MKKKVKKKILKPLETGEKFTFPCGAIAEIQSVTMWNGNENGLICLKLSAFAGINIGNKQDIPFVNLRFRMDSIPQIIKILQRAQKVR